MRSAGSFGLPVHQAAASVSLGNPAPRQIGEMEFDLGPPSVHSIEVFPSAPIMRRFTFSIR